MSQPLDGPQMGTMEHVPTDEDLPEFESIFKKIVENVLLAFESKTVIKPRFTVICRSTLRSERRTIGASSENDVKKYEKKEEHFVRDHSYAMPQYNQPQIRAEAPESAKSAGSIEQSSEGIESSSLTAQASKSRAIPHVKHPKSEQTFIFEHQEKQTTSGVEDSIEPKAKRPKVENQVESEHHETTGTDTDSLLEVKTELLETDDHVESEPHGASGLRFNESSRDIKPRIINESILRKLVSSSSSNDVTLDELLESHDIKPTDFTTPPQSPSTNNTALSRELRSKCEPTTMSYSNSPMLPKKVYPTCIRKRHLLETLQDVAQYANLNQFEKDVEKDLADMGLEQVIDAEQVLTNLQLAITNMGMFSKKGSEGSGLMKSSKAFLLMLHFAEQFDPLRHLTSDRKVESAKKENLESVIDVKDVEFQLNYLRRIFANVQINS
ncbi:hypothetical protein L3Y34_019290 [Caenorhabditis briggsae]|uniref:Uncharacterized protein n=1 Tax=Caenorhabditis briggsae TaxID=6238 RepID=A0AAE9DMI1_CAEBR|nr:hypothetical protein L3Y34_019290 [Caenorhabditis briggsae]